MSNSAQLIRTFVTFVLLALSAIGVYTIVTKFFPLPLPENKVIYLRTQYAKGRVIKIEKNTVTLQKDESSYKVEIPETAAIVKNLAISVPKNLESSSSQTVTPVPFENPTPIIKASFSDIQVGNELSVSLKWQNGKFVVENVVIEK